VQIALQTPNVQEGNPGVAFEGQWAPSQPGLDCVALFDGTSWRLELLSGLGTNLRSADALTPAKGSTGDAYMVHLKNFK